MEVAPPLNPSSNEQFMHKNRLQQYAQRAALPLPLYQTVNEGFPHAPQFRSTVVVDGETFRSSQTFAHRKEAEQNVAKMALEGISWKIKQEGCSLIREDSMFCKSILHEYAVKMNLDKPTYTCSRSQGLLPTFISSVLLDGKIYKGATGRNKKQAEQFAARAAIESILGDSNSSARTLMSQVIKSKGKLYAAVPQVNVSNVSWGMNASSGGNVDSLFGNNLLGGKEVQVALTNEMAPVAVHVMACVPGKLPEEKRLKREHTCELSSDLTGSGTALQHQPQAALPSQQISTCSQTVSDDSSFILISQVINETSSAIPSEFTNDIPVMPSNHKRKHSNMGTGELESS